MMTRPLRLAPLGARLALALALLLAPVASATLGAAFAQQVGAVASTDQAEVCANDGQPGSAYSRSHRTSHGPGRPGFEHDHIVPLCLGGADTEANLQWQPIEEARMKDRLEAYACQQVCRYHRVSLATAQSWFLGGGWAVAFAREFQQEDPRITLFKRDFEAALGVAAEAPPAVARRKATAGQLQ